MADDVRRPATVRTVAVSQARLRLPTAALSAAVEAAAAATTPREVAEAALAPLVSLAGVRAGAVVEVDPRPWTRQVLITASSGYDCGPAGTMAAGSALPLDSGMLVTEAVRRSRPMAQGPGPGWVAVPFGGTPTAGALLLSLHAAPPAPGDVALLGRTAETVGRALRRARATDRQRAELAALETGLSVPDSLPSSRLAIRCLPRTGRTCGDVVEIVREDGVTWLLVADVVGSGSRAAVTAHALRSAFRAALVLTDEPAAVLRALDRAAEDGPESFATAVVVRLQAGIATAASAGHPSPLVLGDEGVRELHVPPAGPLGCGLLHDPVATTSSVAAGEVLVAWTDGLVDRDIDVDVAPLLARRVRGDVDGIADGLLADCSRHGPPRDDLSLLVLEV